MVRLFPFAARNKVSSLLLGILALIAGAVLAGLLTIAVQLVGAESEIGTLRDRSLPRLIKLSQLSQESSASIAIAPALSSESNHQYRTEDRKNEH